MTLPSLLVFGAQGRLPSAKELDGLRQTLLEYSQLSALRHAAAGLPHFWRQLVALDARLDQIPRHETCSLALQQWLNTGEAPFADSAEAPNGLALSITVLSHLIQYFRYLILLGGRDPHEKLLGSVQQRGGIQGFCAGFLSAAVVSGLKDAAEFGDAAASALRLAFCIGAYVDLDNLSLSGSKSYSCLAVRADGMVGEAQTQLREAVGKLPEAYISSINDMASVSITLKTKDVEAFKDAAQARGWRISSVGVSGRYHTTQHSATVKRVLHLAEKSMPELIRFASGSLRCPLRSTVDGEVITECSPQQILHQVLSNTLEMPANWYLTAKSAMDDMADTTHGPVAVVGSRGSVPASLVQASGLQKIVLVNQLLPRLTRKPSSRGSDVIESDLGLYAQSSIHPHPDYPPHSVAIVGMAGRFPGADSVDELWDLIIQGKCMVEPAPVEKFGLSQGDDRDSSTRWWGNFLKNRESFDHRFFGKSPREASSWDPQQRILLEVIYEALESAGYFGISSSAGKEPRDYGCYIGAAMNNYYDNVSCHPATAYATVGTSRSFLSGAMSHHFGWTGPSLTIDTACSSSMVSINTACRAITSGECSRAVAGGTNVISSPFDYRNLAAAGFLSPSGQCKPFDASADGYCRGEAVSVVVLKSLREALADHDDILGVIVGSAMNQNDNSTQITAPCSESQVELYRKVLKQSNVRPEQVSYVEAHGTGTGTGDPIEVRSICETFGGGDRRDVLHFASIKGSIGHTEASAGVAGLIKVLLMMKHDKIPAQVNHNALNPNLPRIGQHRMAIPRENLPWNGTDRVALVNSYGAAGSNAALMLREIGPLSQAEAIPTTVPGQTIYPILISAASARSASRYSQCLLEWIKKQSQWSEENLPRLAFHLADRANQTLSHRLVTTISSTRDLEAQLQRAAASSFSSEIFETTRPKPLILVFGGQEGNWIGLSKEVYDSCQVFREQLDLCNEILLNVGLGGLFPHIFQRSPVEGLARLHCGLFSLQYSCAQAWIQSGLKVDAVVGHSFGQLTAFCIAGVLSLEDALKLVVGRALIMEKHWGPEPGSMVFVQANAESVHEAIQQVLAEDQESYLEIACYNGPKSHVVVGSATSTDALVKLLGPSTRCKKLPVTNGFHSTFVDPLLPFLDDLAKGLDWKKPTTIHIETCDEHHNWESPSPSILRHHTRQPVYFLNAVERLNAKFGSSTWLEVGMDTSFTSLVKGCLPPLDGHDLLAPRLGLEGAANDSLVNVTASLWRLSYSVQCWAYHRGQKKQYGTLHLPPHRFEKTSHWLGFTSRGTGDQPHVQASSHDENTNALLYVSEGAAQAGEEAGVQAVFTINAQSDRFKVLTQSHAMAGYTFAPGSLYIEVAARASLLLHGDSEAVTYVPIIEGLQMNSPLVGDGPIKMTMQPTKASSSHDPCWHFTVIKSLPETKESPEVGLDVASGLVSLKRRDNAQTIKEFKRFQTLLGSRYDQVIDDPDADKMQGKHIYRAFQSVVWYGDKFHGVKEISCVGNEAVGRVRITPEKSGPADQRLCDTPMMDSFMQFAGFLTNYFHNPSQDELFLCHRIESLEIGGDFSPDAGEWIVHATMDEDALGNITCDAYVIDDETKKMVVTALGFNFSKMSRKTLARILESASQTTSSSGVIPQHQASSSSCSSRGETVLSQTKPATVPQPQPQHQPASSARNTQLFEIISEVSDLPLDELRRDASLDSLGIDSLMATEVLNDIRAKLGITIGLSEFLFFPNLAAIELHVNSQLGIETATSNSTATPPSSSPSSRSTNILESSQISSKNEQPDAHCLSGNPPFLSPRAAFEDISHNYDKVASSTRALGYWSEAHPHNRRLVLAHVVQAFSDLGCDLNALQSGDQLTPLNNVLDKHARLLQQLHRILEDGGLVSETSDGRFLRTKAAVEKASAQQVYREVLGLYPQHDDINKLVHVVGQQLAECLTGVKEGLQIVFGDDETKKTLENLYELWPLLRTPALLLGDFLTKLLSSSTVQDKFRILEIGAGTGGTTRYIVNRLKAYGIPFEYIFTDISPALVKAAKKAFVNDREMKFEVLDIEQSPRQDLLGAFDCIIATNCIHATRNIEASLGNVRQILGNTGVLCLIEIMSDMYWLDIVVGLFEGWWLFQDTRTHALVDERRWERALKNAGFGPVVWTDGQSPESKTVRLIAAFPPQTGPPESRGLQTGVETVAYKTIGGQDIMADIYYPLDSGLSKKKKKKKKKMPIALMIHGGSHILFSRKDVRPAQTRLLLERGFLPVSLDHRLCPEVSLVEGPMVDVCDALSWARNTLPRLQLKQLDLDIDGSRVVVVGWSSGGQLAMSLAYTAPARGLQPPEAILAFYCPTDYEDPWWLNPIQPNGVEDQGEPYDVLEAVQERPITNYTAVGAWEPLSDPRILIDPRCRIVLHINWKAQTLPVIINGLASRRQAEREGARKDWNALPQPSVEEVRAVSGRHHIRTGTYRVPTFFIHGTKDDLIPYQQTEDTYKELCRTGVPTGLELVADAPHICDLSSSPESLGWQATVKGYNFIEKFV